MGRNNGSVTVVFLIAIIIALLIPVAADFYASGPAFTSDNLITLQKIDS
ncbi:MAG: hypothetical protein GX808_09195 [Syntrophomonadaceae bacterium]|jgi:Mg/Co/Ni transporter MgtE|nr:hypothetical protein [Syntrophomonadaceae bacterium]